MRRTSHFHSDTNSNAEFLQSLHPETSLSKPLFLVFCVVERPNHIGVAAFVKVSFYCMFGQGKIFLMIFND